MPFVKQFEYLFTPKISRNYLFMGKQKNKFKKNTNYICKTYYALSSTHSCDILKIVTKDQYNYQTKHEAKQLSNFGQNQTNIVP